MTDPLKFISIETLNFDGGRQVEANHVAEALNIAAKSRGIIINGPSDALDASHDIIVDEALHSLGRNYDIVDHTLRVWPNEFPNWPI